jgi:hypothetical protein
MSGTRSEEKDGWTVADMKKQASTFATVQLFYKGYTTNFVGSTDTNLYCRVCGVQFGDNCIAGDEQKVVYCYCCYVV